jgi:ABC-type nitrate/sulfonate/bicarbonate transport system permease component
VRALTLVLAAWWLASRATTEFVLPTPGEVAERAWSERDALLDQVARTFGRVAVAYALACVAGVALGTLVGRVDVVRRALRPVVSFLFPTPKVALYPAMLIVLGLGAASKIGLGFAEALFPILLATAAGTSRVDARLRWTGQTLGVRAPLLRIVVPAALPAILTGARIGLVGAIVGVFLAEMIAGADGLGHQMAISYRTLDTPEMYVAIIAVSLAGYALDRAFLLVRRRALAWSVEG